MLVRVASSAGELHIVRIAPRLRHPIGERGQTLITADPELPLKMQVGGGNERVDTRPLGSLDRFTGTLDIGRVAAGQNGNHRSADLGGDQLHGMRVVRRRDRKAGLDDIDPEHLELPGASSIFSWVFIENPGDCSPSRRVVSKMISFSFAIDLPNTEPCPHKAIRGASSIQVKIISIKIT